MIYVILVMGFSGTTLASELLHHSVIFTTNMEEDPYDVGEKYENLEFQTINKALLRLTDWSVHHLRTSDHPMGLTPGPA